MPFANGTYSEDGGSCSRYSQRPHRPGLLSVGGSGCRAHLQPPHSSWFPKVASLVTADTHTLIIDVVCVNRQTASEESEVLIRACRFGWQDAFLGVDLFTHACTLKHMLKHTHAQICPRTNTHMKPCTHTHLLKHMHT